MCAIFIFILICVFSTNVRASDKINFLSEAFIDGINEVANTWKAGENFPPETSPDYVLRLLGSKGVKLFSADPWKFHDPRYVADHQIPKNFDARQRWKNCTSIGLVRDQGNCGACWAFSTTGAFADRLCIATRGIFNKLLSAEEVTSCCYRCGYGCAGGYPIQAWKHFKRNGVVTGGNYNSKDGCQPYRFPHITTNTTDTLEKTHKCTKQCYGDTAIQYRNDHRYAKSAYYLNYRSIQKDILAYGPIEMTFDVYNDFPSYKHGVYVRSPNAELLNGHSVKCIGWGVENGLPYWLMVNSWNTSWGDKGLFKIRRGTNECDIEYAPTAGLPNV